MVWGKVSISKSSDPSHYLISKPSLPVTVRASLNFTRIFRFSPNFLSVLLCLSSKASQRLGMHPQLSDKRISPKFIALSSNLASFIRIMFITVCREFIQALEACHASTWSRLTGGCNQQKNSLNKCLRKEASWTSICFPPVNNRYMRQRLERSSKNRQQGKEKRMRIEEGWKELREE